MVNASLNWASIVGIVLAVGGALLYFMRSFKPALARDYDVFFAAIGLLCGGILFFQGWRLDPILQFGQFLLAGTTVFFAYESVRLRGVTTEQARRSSFFDDDEPPMRPRMGGGREAGGDYDRFDEPQPLRRRIPSREADDADDFYRPRRSSRAAIPERAASRRGSDDWDSSGERSRGDQDGLGGARRYRASGEPPSRGASEFGSRRRERDERGEVRRGSRPVASGDSMPRSSRRPPGRPVESPAGVPQGSPISKRTGGPGREGISDADYTPMNTPPSRRASGANSDPSASPGTPPRDNSSRFDD